MFYLRRKKYSKNAKPDQAQYGREMNLNMK